MHDSDTSCLVRLLGPIQDCSFCDAFAEIVIIALMKSPAEVCVAGGYSFAKYARRRGIRS